MKIIRIIFLHIVSFYYAACERRKNFEDKANITGTLERQQLLL